MTTRRLANRALTWLAVLGVAGLVVAVAAPLLGVHTYVVRSGSMAPTLSRGDVVVTHREPTARLHPGDVVTVRTTAGSWITHRVVERGPAGLVLHGDANRADDPAPYRVSEADRVVGHLPLVGYAVAVAITPGGVVALLLLVALVVHESGRRVLPRGRGRPTVAAGGVALLAGVVVLVLGARPASAAWVDSVPVSGSSYAAGTVGAPVVTCGALVLGRTTLSWTAVPGATAYVLHEGTGGATTETVPATTTSKDFVVAVSGTFWVEAQQAFAGSTWTSAASNKKSYTVAATVGTCTAAS